MATTITPDQWSVLWDQLSSEQSFRKAILKDLGAAALRAESVAKLNATTRHRVRTGLMRRSTKGKILPKQEGLGISVGSAAPYAETQDRGNREIRSRRSGGYLSIPLDPVRTAAGVGRFPSPLMDPEDLFVWRSPTSGHLFLATSDGGTLQLRWLLLESVTIKGSRWLTDAIKDGGEDMIRRVSNRVRTILLGRS